ncbi:PTB domain (IRS-1 type) [Nesidiocoris tenuis]|uniref:PTB domain (IRS-1 type) n=1 Tax=Nesidiocoris tenuis TaxID=355587 RepID=A0ABN7A541_9HEMI|nr:PTB domain (IRS-1 type) [Nesidiocoris tenuis]
MGCITSKKDINDLHPNIFQVSNVDDIGNRHSSGQLEVNDTELVLHQKGKPPIRWPLKSLRRYGYDSQVFSFEAGRRCPTGSGIYAFSCRRAENLFNFVQANVQQRNSEDQQSRELRTPTPSQSRPQSGAHLELASVTPTSTTTSSSNAGGIRHPSLPRVGGVVHNNPSRLNSVGSSNGCVSPSPPHTVNNNYSEFFPVEITDISAEAVGATYMNVNCGADIIQEQEETPIYANLTPGSGEPLSYADIVPSTPVPAIRMVNYIVLDLNATSNDSSKTAPHPPESPSRPSQGYVTIDFDKTLALSNSANPNPNFDDECSRRTRHNSTIVTPGLISSVRHSVSLSD